MEPTLTVTTPPGCRVWMEGGRLISSWWDTFTVIHSYTKEVIIKAIISNYKFWAYTFKNQKKR